MFTSIYTRNIAPEIIFTPEEEEANAVSAYVYDEIMGMQAKLDYFCGVVESAIKLRNGLQQKMLTLDMVAYVTDNPLLTELVAHLAQELTALYELCDSVMPSILQLSDESYSILQNYREKFYARQLLTKELLDSFATRFHHLDRVVHREINAPLRKVQKQLRILDSQQNAN